MAYILTRKNPIVTETKTGSILTFNSALPVVADDVTSLITGYQEGSGTPSPDNVRNLVSFDECTVAKSGKTLLNDSVSNRTMDGKNIIFNGDSKPLSKCVYLKQGVTYTISIGLLDGTSTNIYITNSETGYGITGFPAYNVNSKTFTVSKDGYYCVWSYKADYTSVNSVSYCQIEIGSTFTTYEPYKGNTYTFSFGQSIYEGTIDFTTGVLTANRILVTLTGDSSESYALSASNRRINYSISGILLNSGVDDTVDGYLCNRFEQITPNQSYRTNMGFAVNTTNSVIFFNDGSGEMTVEGWRTWLASNNIQLAVMLASPLEIQLTPTEISLLQGTNNLWSSTGNLTVQFKNVK